MPSEILNKPETLVSLVEYQNRSIVSKVLVQNKYGSITLFAFDAGEGLSEHTAPFDAFVQLLDGELNITMGGAVHELHAGDVLIMSANLPHALTAKVRTKMLLVMIKE